MAAAGSGPARIRTDLCAKVRSIASAIVGGKITKIAVLNGAGISVPSGIPDFRSPGGMYASLRPELLTATAAQKATMAADPTAVVSWSLFSKNSLPYLEVRRPFILGTLECTWRPTVAHGFFALLEKKKLLTRVYTQNIDGLQEQTCISGDKVLHVHGSLDRAACEFCGTPYPFADFVAAVRAQIRDIYAPSGSFGDGPEASTPVTCLSATCGKPGVKPCTVLYGRSLPEEFGEALHEDFPEKVDLLIVAGTSLTVGPANMIPFYCGAGVPRLVVNMEPVGDFEFDDAGYPDAFVGGDIDDAFVALAEELGWLEDLRGMATTGECDFCPESRKALGLQ